MRTITRRSLATLLSVIPFLDRTCKPVANKALPDQTHYNAIVIGAGAAGLAAARTLQDAKLNAIYGLGAGRITKLILKFDQPIWSKELESCLTTLDTQLWWRPGWRRAPVLTAYTGATGADKLGALGREGAIRIGLQHLEQIFEAPLADRLIDALFVDWQADPYARMAYSYTPVNGMGLRSQLAQPIDQVLFFAGEATHPTRAATVHGALESGIRAAHEILSLNTNRSA